MNKDANVMNKENVRRTMPLHCLLEVRYHAFSPHLSLNFAVPFR